ncbi:uncharacterized protein C1orf131 homolog [Uloborus diversus]|uniref:uncharacterized protein C1orf131 homolog n=1 Tax=Uloborus diversus TaxID=327109 RepID=UPI0024097CCC|nr:uncharacterized protein C1orf131 homolog [Uloborus diversus]
MAASSSDGVEVVCFNERFCGRKAQKKNSPSDVLEKKFKEPDKNVKVFNIKRARYEVIRFGMSGFDKEKHLNAKIAMAIRLGAKPPKKPNINYKELMKMKKEQKTNENEQRKYSLQPLKGRKTSKKKKPKNQPNALV